MQGWTATERLCKIACKRSPDFCARKYDCMHKFALPGAKFILLFSSEPSRHVLDAVTTAPQLHQEAGTQTGHAAKPNSHLSLVHRGAEVQSSILSCILPICCTSSVWDLKMWQKSTLTAGRLRAVLAVPALAEGPGAAPRSLLLPELPASLMMMTTGCCAVAARVPAVHC